MNIENVSLGEFERRHGVNKGTVSKKARELGYATGDGLTPEAYERLKLEFQVDEATTAKTEVVDEAAIYGADALGYYFGGSLGAPGGDRQFSLGDLTTRIHTREARRLSVAQDFQEVTVTREDRRSMLIQAAIADADDDSEVYAAVYQKRLSKNLQRHGMASGAVMGKDIEPPSEAGDGSSTAA